VEQQKHNVVFASDMSSDYRSGYLDALRVVDIIDYRNRVAAFGALRRAAETARECDNWAAIAIKYGFDDDAPLHKAQGIRVRQAIRAAIGSDKT